ncbi:hypothetical protein [Phaeospirillum tilakii]|uniref:(2Fe-2S) ferredoxin n=1 Tax=Phaeospirillum tilakii TaxID=741673 RepID=A0ABW5CEY0_9PROT
MRLFARLRAAGGRHRHGFHHHRHGGGCGLGKAVAASPEQRPGPVRLYACVGKHCPDGRRVLDALRVAAAESGVAVAPCGCLDLCEQGPVVIALPAEAPPPRRGATGPAPLATHLRVSPADAARIVATFDRHEK